MKQKEQEKFQIEVAGGVGRWAAEVAEEKYHRNGCLWIGLLKENSSVILDFEFGRRRAENQGREEEGIYFSVLRDVGWREKKKQIKIIKKYRSSKEVAFIGVLMSEK